MRTKKNSTDAGGVSRHRLLAAGAAVAGGACWHVRQGGE